MSASQSVNQHTTCTQRENERWCWVWVGTAIFYYIHSTVVSGCDLGGLCGLKEKGRGGGGARAPCKEVSTNNRWGQGRNQVGGQNNMLRMTCKDDDPSVGPRDQAWGKNKRPGAAAVVFIALCILRLPT